MKIVILAEFKSRRIILHRTQRFSNFAFDPVQGKSISNLKKDQVFSIIISIDQNALTL